MRRQTIGTALALVGWTALGFLLRTTNAASVLAGGRIVLPENDPDFHLHRIVATLADFPRVPLYDRAIDFPYGGAIIWPPLFDLALAAACRAAGLGPGDGPAIELLTSLLIPLLGGAMAIPTYLLARPILGRPWALLAAGLAILVPAHLWYSRLGFVDHHVAVTLLQVSMFAVFLRGCTAATPGRVVAWAVAGGLAIAAGLATWNGYLLLVAILDLFLLAALVAAGPAARARIALLAALAHALAAVAILPLARASAAASGEPLSPLVVSYLHVAALAGAAAVAAIVWAASALAAVRPLLRLAALGAGVAMVAGAIGVAAASPLGRGFAWLAASDPFMAAVQEVVPMLRGGDGRLDVAHALVWMTALYAAVPLLLAGLAWRVARERGRDVGRLLLLVWASCLFALSLAQRRFGESFAPALAILVCFWLAEAKAILARWLAARGAAPSTADRVSRGAIALALAAALAPYYAPLLAAPQRLAALPRALAGAAPTSADDLPADVRVQEVAERFREVLRARGELPAPGAPTRGVMNTWPIGHKLLRITGLGVASTPFGGHARPEGFHEWSDFFLADDEDEAIALLDARRLRWVAVDADLAPIGSAIVGRGEDPRSYYGKVRLPDGGFAYPPQRRLARTLYFRLTALAGTEAEIANADGAAERIPALERLRLVVDSPRDDGPGAVRVFERVAGARMAVSAPPGQRGELAYEFTSDAGRSRAYRRSFVVGGDGRAELRVPYATAPDGPGAAYRVCVAPRCAEVRVGEAEVRDGARIAVRLAGDAPASARAAIAD